MENTSKIYIGKGTQVKNFDLFNITINLSKALEHAFTNEAGEKLLRFSFTKTKEADRYGKTHTAYLQVKNETPVAQETAPPTKKKAKAKVKATPADDDKPSFINH